MDKKESNKVRKSLGHLRCKSDVSRAVMEFLIDNPRSTSREVSNAIPNATLKEVRRAMQKLNGWQIKTCGWTMPGRYGERLWDVV